MLAFIRRFAQRLLTMVGGEAIQSALHFGVNIGLLRVLSTHDYGVFALVMIIGGISLTYVRALAAMPAIIWIGRGRDRAAAAAYNATFGSAALVLAAAIAVIVGLILYGWLGTDAIAGSAFVGLWSLRSYLRAAVFARGKVVPAVVGDLVFTTTGAVLLTALLWVGVGNQLQSALALLALANGLSIAVMAIVSPRLIQFSLRRSVWRRYYNLGRQLVWSAVGVTAINLQGQGMALVVAVIAGPTAYAPIAAVLVMFTPVRLVDAAAANMMQPDLAYHVARHEFGLVWRQAGICALIIGCGCLLYGSAVMLILPRYDLAVFNGSSTRVILLLVWALYAVAELRVMPKIILEIVGSLRAIAIISGISAGVGMVVVAGILRIATPEWSLLGAVVSESMALAGFCLALRSGIGGNHWKGSVGRSKWVMS